MNDNQKIEEDRESDYSDSESSGSMQYISANSSEIDEQKEIKFIAAQSKCGYKIVITPVSDIFAKKENPEDGL